MSDPRILTEWRLARYAHAARAGDDFSGKVVSGILAHVEALAEQLRGMQSLAAAYLSAGDAARAERDALKADIARHVCPHPIGSIRLLHQDYNPVLGGCWRCSAPAPWPDGATCPGAGEKKP